MTELLEPVVLAIAIWIVHIAVVTFIIWFLGETRIADGGQDWNRVVATCTNCNSVATARVVPGKVHVYSHPINKCPTCGETEFRLTGNGVPDGMEIVDTDEC